MALLGAAPPLSADIFQWRDADGRTYYGDSPPERTAAQRLDSQVLPPVNTRPAPSQLPKRAAPARTRAPDTSAPRKATLKQCVAAKKKAVRAEQKRPRHGDPQLESWLWKNCRNFSHELRKVSQSMM
jgi:hypothetical protein